MSTGEAFVADLIFSISRALQNVGIQANNPISETQMDRSIAFWDRIAKGYANDPIADEESYQVKLNKTAEALVSDARVLEIGGGTGTTAVRLSPHLGEILCTEPSQQMIEIARRRAEEAGANNIRFLQASVDDLVEGDLLQAEGPFDAVLAFNVLHVLKNPQAAIEGASAAIKPGGALITSTMFMSAPFKAFAPLVWIGKAIGKLPNVAFISDTKFVQWQTTAGLEMEYRWKPKGFKATYTLARKRS